jgi:hypothetical protein
LRFSSLADRVVTTLYELAEDPATDKTELNTRLLDLLQAKLPHEVLAKLKALDRMMGRASLQKRVSSSLGRALGVLKDFGKAGMSRLRSVSRAGATSSPPMREKIKRSFDNLTTGLKDISSLNLEALDETDAGSPDHDVSASNPPSTAVRRLEAPQIKPVKFIPGVKREVIH